MVLAYARNHAVERQCRWTERDDRRALKSLKSSSCKGCGERTPPFARVCPHCGRTLVHRTRRDHSAPVACPACGVPNKLLALGGVTIDTCRRCGGTWFDDAELDQLADDLAGADLARDAIAALGTLGKVGVDSRKVVRYFPCPVCQDMMNRRNYRDVSGIILHRCSGHGTWLDRVNAGRLFRVIADGRLYEIQERATALGLEAQRRQVAKLDASRIRLAQQFEEVGREHRHPHANVVRGIVLAILDFIF